MPYKSINRAVQCRMFLQLKRLVERAQYEKVSMKKKSLF
jgi:hypothetical protein